MKKIRSKAPLRIGLAGGGTDLDVYADMFGGYVLNTTISLYVHCNIEENNSNKIIFESMDLKDSTELNIQKALTLDGHMDLYKATYNYIAREYNLELKGFILQTYSDVPSGSGLGGSSTLIVSMIKAYTEWLNLPLGEYDIAKIAFEIEREEIGIVGGAQDQYAATFGGFNFMEFYKEKRVIVNPLRIKNWIIDELESSMILYFTGIQRGASQIEEEKKSLIKKEESLNAMHEVKKDAVLMKDFLLKGDIENFAKILGKAWVHKKNVSKIISNKEIDRIYDLAISKGAYSGKVSGAGGGGFMFFIVKPMDKLNLVRELDKEKGKVINFKFVKEGTKGWIV